MAKFVRKLMLLLYGDKIERRKIVSVIVGRFFFFILFKEKENYKTKSTLDVYIKKEKRMDNYYYTLLTILL